MSNPINNLINKFTGKSSFTNSGEYWENRYRNGGNSGAGSYNRLAEFKAEFLNKFVLDNNIQSIIEFGSGDGAQLALAKYPHYIGIDVSHTAIEFCRKQFVHNPNISFLHTSELTNALKADLSLSLDVIYHLIEDDVFEKYVNNVLDAAERYSIFYSSNKNEITSSSHVKHRYFSDYIAKNRPDFKFEYCIPNRYPYEKSNPHDTSFADFYIFSGK